MKYTMTLKTRRKMSESAKRRCTPEWRARKSEQVRTKIDDEKLERLYAGGMNQEEVAAELGVSQKVVWNAMKRLGIKARPQVARNPKRGQESASWVGDAACYSALHLRVISARGNPSMCSTCGTTTATRYEWANLTGDYANVEDYVRMCRSCHRRYDAKRRAATGKRTSPADRGPQLCE